MYLYFYSAQSASSIPPEWTSTMRRLATSQSSLSVPRAEGRHTMTSGPLMSIPNILLAITQVTPVVNQVTPVVIPPVTLQGTLLVTTQVTHVVTQATPVVTQVTPPVTIRGTLLVTIPRETTQGAPYTTAQDSPSAAKEVILATTQEASSTTVAFSITHSMLTAALRLKRANW